MVTVIIPSFDRFNRLIACLESVVGADPEPAGGVETIVVTSTYEPTQLSTIEEIGASVVRLSHRSLVSASRNAGASVAHGDHLLFLDDDNVLAPDAIWHLWRALQRWGDAALVGPVMYYGSAPERIWCAGVSRSQLLMKTTLISQLPDPLPERFPSEDFPNCFMVRREEFDRAGGFDVRHFPQHMEEGDLARRLVHLTGKQVFCVPQAKVWHFIETSFVHRLHMHDSERAYLVSKGRAVYTAMYGSRLQWFIYVLAGQFALAGVYLWVTLVQRSSHRIELVVAYMRGMVTGLWLGTMARRGARFAGGPK